MNVLGPVPCQGCRHPTWWSGLEWVSRTGIRHNCGWKINRTKGRNALAIEHTNSYDSRAGSSSESASIANDAHDSATTRDVGVVATIEVVAR